MIDWRRCRGWTGVRERKGWRDWNHFRDKKVKSTTSRSRRRETKRNSKTSRRPLKVLAKNDTERNETAKKGKYQKAKTKIE